jgi:prohibitin 1
MKTQIISIMLLVLLLSSCAVIRQGEIGVKRKMGKLSPKFSGPGAVGFNPFTSKVIKMPIRTMNMEINANLPSKEGLNIIAVISILYRMQPEKAPSIIETIGIGNEVNVISSVFRSSAADVCSRFFAKDMHSVQRATIEREVTEQMTKILLPRGFEIEAVEEKLEAEQQAQRMEFLLDREKREAQRKIIEAEGIRDSQKIIAEGLTKAIIEWQSIEAFRELAKSPNSKIIMTDGKTPLLINPTDR